MEVFSGINIEQIALEKRKHCLIGLYGQCSVLLTKNTTNMAMLWNTSMKSISIR